MCLRDAVYHVRSEIGELQEFNWSDFQIIKDLNDDAKAMCSDAQSLTRYDDLLMSSVGAYQEAALDVEIDKVKDCKYFLGGLYDLYPREFNQLQTGNSVGSQPIYYYLKTGTKDLTPQDTDGDITRTPIQAQNFGGTAFYTVLGIWPKVTTDANIHVWYSYFHPYMQDPTDICMIPPHFFKDWCSGAIARCLRIENDAVRAATYEAKFDKGKDAYRVWAASQRRGNQTAQYGKSIEPWRRNASSSVIFVDPNPTMGA